MADAEPADLVLRFLTSIGRPAEAQQYLDLFRAEHPERFAIVHVAEAVVRNAAGLERRARRAGAVDVDVDEVVPGRVDRDPADAGAVAVVGADHAERARLRHGVLARERAAVGHAVGDDLGPDLAGGAAGPLAGRQRAGRQVHALALVRVVGRDLDRSPAIEHEQLQANPGDAGVHRGQ